MTYRKKLNNKESNVESLLKPNNSFIVNKELERLSSYRKEEATHPDEEQVNHIFQCDKCLDKKLIRSDESRVWVKCICARKEYVTSLMKECTSFDDPDLKFRNPKQLLKFEDLAFVKTSIYDFRHYVAGYLLQRGLRRFQYISAQEFFDARMDNDRLGNYIRADIVVIDFLRVPPNKALPLYIMQLCEERKVRGKITWMIASLSKSSLAANFRDSAEEFLEFLDSLPNYIYDRSKHSFGRPRSKTHDTVKATKEANNAYFK